MKGRILKLVILLLLGAIINVAVAWGCAVTSPIVSYHEFKHDLPDAEAERLWRKYMGKLDEYEKDSIFGESGSIRGTTKIFLGSMPLGDPVSIYSWSATSDILQAGWPFRSLEGGDYYNVSWEMEIGNTKEHNLLSLHPLPWPARTYNWYGRVPTKPIWPGFLANTLVYGLFMCGLLYGMRTASRFIRRRRGLCIKCGYDLRGASGGGGGGVCPECGESGRSPRALVEGNWRRS